MKVVVVGFGSIGKRHVNNLISLGIEDITLCRSKKTGNFLNLKEIDTLEEILLIKPNFVVVSNPTALHYETLQFLISNNINVLCEKPLLSSKKQWAPLENSLKKYNGKSKVVYNLRLHPCVQKVKEILEDNSIGSINYARFFVGQYLPDWRPNTNHLDSYSSHKKMGGGVVLDLIHEIDIANYLLGKPKEEVQFISKKISNVTVDSVDVAEIIYLSENNQLVNIHLDYLYRGYKRDFLINGSKFNLVCNLSKNTVKITGDNNQIVEQYSFNNFCRNDMYIDALKDYLKSLNNEDGILPSFIENIPVMETSFIVNQ